METIGETGLSYGAVALVVGFPLLLMVLLAFLGHLEEWMLQPDERARQVVQLLERLEEAEEVERAVAKMLGPVAGRVRSRSQRRWRPRGRWRSRPEKGHTLA